MFKKLELFERVSFGICEVLLVLYSFLRDDRRCFALWGSGRDG